MRSHGLLLIVLGSAACAGTVQPARAYRAEAKPTAESYQCGDTTLNDQQTSGTEKVTNWQPCWDHTEAAPTVREAPTRITTPQPEQAQAVALARTELGSCRGIPKGELAHSPFSHRRVVAQVIPHRSGGQIHGVRIVMHPVPGLTADYMKRAIGCQQARFAALGNSPAYLSDDPTLVDGAEIAVTEHRGHLEVFVRSDSDVAGAVALARAQDLVRTRTAAIE